MANRRFRSQFRFGHEAMVVDLYAKIAIGAAGAPTLNAPLSKGIASVVRNSAGSYTITLQDRYTRLIHLSADQVPNGGLAAPIIVQDSGAAVNDAPPTVSILTLDTAGLPTDPDDTNELNIHLILSNSSVANS